MTHRLNKLISDSGLCSRREADRFIESGRVTINGNVAQLGAFVQDEDKVLVDGFPINMNAVAIRIAKGKQQNAQSTSSNKLSNRAKGILAQQMASAPKSAALRKTSKNNPANRPQLEEEEETPFVPYRKFYRKDEGRKTPYSAKEPNSQDKPKSNTPDKFRDSKAEGAYSKPRSSRPTGASGKFGDSKTEGAFGKPRNARAAGAPGRFNDSKTEGAFGKPRNARAAGAPGKFRDSKTEGAFGKPRSERTDGTSGRFNDSKTEGGFGKTRNTRAAGAPGKFHDSKTEGAFGKPRNARAAGAPGKFHDSKFAGASGKPRTSKAPNKSYRKSER
ncbi:MAG: S4 domain-containing protein [Parabacteroides sp.]|nr:S4 domain-containing protein [Parabacteroides sp.]